MRWTPLCAYEVHIRYLSSNNYGYIGLAIIRNKMVKKYHNIKTDPKSNLKMVEIKAKPIPLTHIYMTNHFPRYIFKNKTYPSLSYTFMLYFINVFFLRYSTKK